MPGPLPRERPRENPILFEQQTRVSAQGTRVTQGSAFTLARVLATLVRGGSPLTRMNALPCQGEGEFIFILVKGEFILVKGVLRFSLVQEKFSLVKGKHSSLSRKTVHPDKGGHRPGCGGISLSLTRPGGTVSLLVRGRGYLTPPSLGKGPDTP